MCEQYELAARVTSGIQNPTNESVACPTRGLIRPFADVPDANVVLSWPLIGILVSQIVVSFDKRTMQRQYGEYANALTSVPYNGGI